MGRTRSEERSQAESERSAGEMRQRLRSWRRGEPGASFVEKMERVRLRIGVSFWLPLVSYAKYRRDACAPRDDVPTFEMHPILARTCLK